jgi:hypothetical protein
MCLPSLRVCASVSFLLPEISGPVFGWVLFGLGVGSFLCLLYLSVSSFILHVYLGAPYAFYKFLFTYKKKSGPVLYISIPF